LAALTFVAKEAFYKCQFPVTRERLDFDAVAVHLQGLFEPSAHWESGMYCVDPPAPELGGFWIEPTRPLRLQTLYPASLGEPGTPGGAEPRWLGHFRLHDGFISAGIALPISSR